MTENALCQDCLRLVVIPDHESVFNTADSDNIHCECGGDLCSCDSCQHELFLFEKGIFEKEMFHHPFWETIKNYELFWDPEIGLKVGGLK